MGNAELDNEWVKNVRAGLAARKNSRPTTKMGAVRSLWPEIEQALYNGQTLKDIRDWLEAEGLSLGYSQFTFYVRRIRLKQAQTGALPSSRLLKKPARRKHGLSNRAATWILILRALRAAGAGQLLA